MSILTTSVVARLTPNEERLLARVLVVPSHGGNKCLPEGQRAVAVFRKQKRGDYQRSASSPSRDGCFASQPQGLPAQACISCCNLRTFQAS